MALRSRKETKKRRVFGLAIIVMVIFVLILAEANLRPVILTLGESRIRQMTAKTLNDAVRLALSEQGPKLKLIDVMLDGNGKVVCLQANQVKLDEIASHAATYAQDTMAQISEQNLNIPLGAAFGMKIFSGFGPLIPIRTLQNGNVVAEYHTEFVSTGINQTRHRMVIRLKAQVTLLVPTGSKNIEINTDIPVSETVLIGNVPQTYVNVANKDEMLNLLPMN